jgi:hypothetical protein
MRRRVIIFCILLISLLGSVYAEDYYKVTVTRKDNDLYKVETTKFYIQTQFCYQYVYFEAAILRIDSTYGFTIGKLIFDNGTTCDVKAVI